MRVKNLAKRNEIRNETIALITHEMRTSLTSSSWAILLILKNYTDKISEKDRRMLEGVVDSIKATAVHSVHLLDISLLDVRKLNIYLSTTNLNTIEEMFKEITEKFAFGAGREGITLKSNIKLDPEKEVDVDMVRLRVIIENLLDNAIQYSGAGKKEIEVKIDNDEKNLNIMIRDTGIGIPESEQADIFSEFYRATNAKRKLEIGSGIGLFMCKKYVSAHHGTIRFESRENQGTTFFITIPLKSETPTAIAINPQAPQEYKK